MSDQEARDAVAAYAEAQESLKEPEKVKRSALDTLKAWMRRQGDSKATVNGKHGQPSAAPRGTRSTTASSTSVLDPEVRADDRDGEQVRSTSGSARRSHNGAHNGACFLIYW